MKDKLSNTRRVMHKEQSEIAQEVTAIATYYPNMIKVYKPFVPIKKILPGWELDQKTQCNVDFIIDKTSNESPEERSIRRSQQIIRDYILCNRFNMFLTITMAADRYDLERSKDKLNNWLKNQRDRNGKFEYVIVPEYHKDSAIHFHGVFNHYNGRIKKSRSSKTGRLLTGNHKLVYEFEEYKSGFSRVQYIDDSNEDRSRVGNYICKYITKDMISVFGKKRFWASQGLKKPHKEYNPSWFEDLVPDNVYENNYGQIYTFVNLWDKAIPAEVLNNVGLSER